MSSSATQLDEQRARTGSSATANDPRGLAIARIGAGLAVAASIGGVVMLTRADVTELGPYGLVHSLPWGIYPCMAVQAASFIVTLRLPRQRNLLLLLPLLGAVLLLHGAASIAQPIARFPTAWIHAGFAEHIMANGDVLTDMDARFSWPGFFAGAATLTVATGLERPDAWLRWAPLFFVGAYLPPLLVIARSLVEGWRVPWLTLWAFVFINWVGQDYFAPQSFGLLLTLCVLAICLSWFKDPAPSERRWWKRLDIIIARGREPRDTAAPERARAGLLAVVVVLASALAVSHQLSPFVLLAFLGVLFGVRRLRPGTLPVLVGLLALGWLGYGAVPYWISHLGDIFGGAGDVAGVVGSTLGDRLGGSPEHRAVLSMRMGFSVLVWATAAVGIVRRVRHLSEVDITVMVLAATPFGLLALQSYGGEGMLRLFLLSSPFVAVLVARAFVPAEQLANLAAVVLLIASVALLPWFHVARHGNESFERVTIGEAEVVDQLYARAPDGATLLAVSPHVGWRHHDIRDYDHRIANDAGFTVDSVSSLTAMIPAGQPVSYLLVTDGQLAFVERVLGAPNGWGDALTRDLDEDTAFNAVFRNDEGAVYRYTRKDTE